MFAKGCFRSLAGIFSLPRPGQARSGAKQTCDNADDENYFSTGEE
jgi:hypothetical protein